MLNYKDTVFSNRLIFIIKAKRLINTIPQRTPEKSCIISDHINVEHTAILITVCQQSRLLNASTSAARMASAAQGRVPECTCAVIVLNCNPFTGTDK